MDQPLLTPLELKVMNILWKLERAFVKDIIEHWPEPERPAYNTVSTIIRILEDPGKGKHYVGHEAVGRSHRYYPLVSKAAYQKRFLHNAVDQVFAGSFQGLISSLLDQEKLSAQEIQSLKDMIDQSDAS